MALGDFAIDSRPGNGGDRHVLTGTLEANSTATAFQILSTKSSITSAQLHNIDDVDTTVQVVINSDDGTEGSDNGSLYVDTSSADVDTFRFRIEYV